MSLLIWQFAWRNLMRRKRRTILTLIAIIIGVASTFAVIAAVDSAQKAFPIYLEEAFGKADFTIYGTDAYFSEEVLKEAQKIEGAEVVAALKENTKLYLEDETISAIQKRVVLTGYSNLDTDLTKFKVLKGDLSAGGAIITDKTAAIMNLDVGQTLSFETDQGIKTIEISAIVRYTNELMGPGNWGMAKYHHWSVAVPLSVVQDWYDLSGKVQGILVKAHQESDLAKVEQQVDALTKRYDDIYMQPVIIEYSMDQLDSYFIALYIAGFLGIALSAFVIFNSLFVSVKERKKEFAALKTIGFTSTQLQIMVLTEVLLFSIIGTVIGLLIGYGFGLVLKSLFFMLVGVFDDSKMEIWKGILFSSLAGLFVPIVASLYPIRQAGKVTVIEALHENRATKSYGNKWLLILGILLIGSAFFIKHLLLVVPLMIGIALIFPYLFHMFGFLLKPIYKVVFGFSGEVATLNLNRNLVRTAMTSLILCLGIAMIVLMSSLNWAMLQTYERVIYSSYGGNLDIMFHHIEKEDLDLLKNIDGIVDAETYALTSAVWILNDQKRRLPIFGVDEETADRFPMFAASGISHSEMIQNLKKDEIILDKISFKVWGGKIGETISLQTLQGTQSFKVVAVVESMKNSGYSAFMGKNHFKENFGLKYERNALVLKDENTSPLQLRERVFAQFGERIEEMWGPEDWVTVIGMQYTSSFSIINVLVILSLIVSGIGITNTLMINIMERIREIGMMRAVGITRKQIIRMIQYEGLGFGLVSTILGCIIGVIIIYITSSFLEINTLTFDFQVSWVILLLCTLFGLAISLFASFSPAKRAAKTELSEALRYE